MTRVRADAIAAIATLLVVLLPAQANSQTDDSAQVVRQLSQDRFTIVAPFPPGGPVDLLARLLAEDLQRRYGQPAVVENIPGGAGNPGMDRVRRARPSGHTLLVIPAGNLTINPTLMSNFPFRIERDFAPVTMLAKAPNVLVAHPSADTTSLATLISAIRRDSRRFSYASPGIGSGLHLAGELFRQQLALDLQHVPYKGTGPAINDVIGGIVPLMFSNLPAALPHVRAGRLVALGITDNARSPVAPDLPTMAELGVAGVVVSSWYGLLAPAATSPAVVAQLARDAAAALSTETVTRQLTAQAMSATAMTPAAFAEHIRAETATWEKVITARGIQAD